MMDFTQATECYKDEMLEKAGKKYFHEASADTVKHKELVEQRMWTKCGLA